MRITVVGTAFIVAAAILVLLVIRALNDNQGTVPSRINRSGYE